MTRDDARDGSSGPATRTTRATHLFLGAVGSATYERVPWYESLTATMSVLGAGKVAFLSVLVLWVGAFARRRLRDRSAPSVRERFARGLLGAVSLLWLAVLGLFVLAVVTHPYVSVFLGVHVGAVPPSLVSLVDGVLRYVALAGTIGVVVATGFAWREGYWNAALRTHYSVVTLLAIPFAWQLYYLRILP